MNHDEALDKIIEHVLKQQSSDDILLAAKSHIAGCRTCIQEMNGIMSVLVGEPATLNIEAEALIECHEIERLLPGYATGIMDSASTDYRRVENHLKTCKQCLGEEKKLAGMIDDVTEQFLEEKAGKPFGVTLSPESGKTSLWEKARADAKSLQTEIKIFVQEDLATFVPFTTSAGLRLAEVQMAIPGQATRSFTKEKQATKDGKTGKETSEPVFQLLEIDDETGDILIELKLIDTSAIEIRLKRFDRSEEIEFAEVRLIDPLTGQIVDAQTTDHEGKTRLRGVLFLSENAYVIRIKHDEKQWEINLSITDVQDSH